MLFCEQCKVHVRGALHCCPLCQSPLSGKQEETVYPVLPPTQKTMRLFLRLAALATIVVAVICSAVNFSLPQTGWWSVLVMAALASTWLVLGVTIHKRGSPMKAIVWQLGAISAITLLWDLFTGFAGWSLNFVLPIFIPCAQLAAFIVAMALCLRPAEYLFCMTLCILAGFLPLILLLCSVLKIIYPSVICVGVSLVALAGLLLFKGRELKDDAVRRLHL